MVRRLNPASNWEAVLADFVSHQRSKMLRAMVHRNQDPGFWEGSSAADRGTAASSRGWCCLWLYQEGTFNLAFLEQNHSFPLSDKLEFIAAQNLVDELFHPRTAICVIMERDKAFIRDCFSEVKVIGFHILIVVESVDKQETYRLIPDH